MPILNTSYIRPSGIFWVSFTLVVITLTICWRRSGHWFLLMKFSKTRLRGTWSHRSRLLLPLEFVWLQFMWIWFECQYSVSQSYWSHIKNPAVGYPVEVGMPLASFDKGIHSFSNQEQETRSSEDRGQPAEEGGHRASSQEPLPGLLQQVVSCSKEDRRSLSCNRPVHAEQTSGDSLFADGDGPDSQGCSPLGQMDGIYKHDVCLMKKYMIL